jgi:hypothetical protein
MSGLTNDDFRRLITKPGAGAHGGQGRGPPRDPAYQQHGGPSRGQSFVLATRGDIVHLCQTKAHEESIGAVCI